MRTIRRGMSRRTSVLLVALLLLSSLSWSPSALAAPGAALTDPLPPGGGTTFTWTVNNGQTSRFSGTVITMTGCWTTDDVAHVSATDATGHALTAWVPGQNAHPGNWNGTPQPHGPASINVAGVGRFPVTITATFTSAYGATDSGTDIRLVAGNGMFGQPPIQTFDVGGPTCQPAYALNLSSTTGGSAAADPSLALYAAGTHVSLTATPGDGYAFTGWTIDGQNAGSDNPYDLVMDQDHTVVANFVKTYTLTLNQSTGGTAAADPPGPTYPDGTQVTLTATADDGYTFAGWTVDGSDVGTQNPYTLTMDQDHTVTPNFTGNTTNTGLPPDPSTVATTNDQTVTTTLANSDAFLYIGPNPIQTGVEPNTIDPVRMAVLRGKVLDTEGNALPGVTITILNHPEFGQTLSRADGLFDLAVNGGGQLTVQYQLGGYLTLQRHIQVPWENYAWLPDVVLLKYDPNVTQVDLSASNSTAMQVARGSQETDQDGTRQATVFFPQGTTATMTLPDGSTQPLDTLHVRATEYTVGTQGPEAMPGDLPAASGYTYAVDLSVDEAVQAGATQVSFSQPVPFYLENFLGFAVGSAVPVGYYDQQTGQWVPEPNGVVIKILSITNGVANVDTTGDGTADNGTSIGMTDAERTELATLYAAGDTLWRVALTHFTPWDCNWPFGPPKDAVAPNQPKPVVAKPKDDDCLNGGSAVGCLNQSLGESVDVSGTPYTLNYNSMLTSGRADGRTVNIPLSGSSIPASLKRIDVQIFIAGREFDASVSAQPNQSYLFTWDGKDAYGRPTQGAQAAQIKIGYVYDAVYETPADTAEAFAQFGMSVSAVPTRGEVVIWQIEWTTLSEWSSQPGGMGGWTLNVHHAYDPVGKRLYLGNGSIESQAAGGGLVIRTAVGGLNQPYGVAAAPDGSLYVADTSNNRVLKVLPDGTTVPFAGSGRAGYFGDGGPATQAWLSSPYDVAVGPDGSVYIADTDNYRVRKVTPDGIIHTFAGGGSQYLYDVPATTTMLYFVTGIAVAPDGTVYFAEPHMDELLKVTPDGIIHSVAHGNGTYNSFGGDGGPVSKALFNWPWDVAIGPDGSVYVVDFNNWRVRKIAPDGIVTTVAGGGSNPPDGVKATDAVIYRPRGIAVDQAGNLYIAEDDRGHMLMVDQQGIIHIIAGNSAINASRNDTLALQTKLYGVWGTAVGPGGEIYFAEPYNGAIRALTSAFPGVGITDNLIPSRDGSQIYHFDAAGRHLETLDAYTGATIYTFGYDTGGRLTSVTDAFGNVTTIQHDANGNPTAIVAPGGQTTTLTVDANGYLAGIGDPDSNQTKITYDGGGLLATFTDPNGNVHTFTYDALGRLTKDASPDGSFTALARTELSDGYQIVESTAMGRSATYQVEMFSTGEQKLTTTEASGGMTVIISKPDGSQAATYPDGTTVSASLGPDPRWGMLAPVLTSMTRTTPGGLTETTSGSRATTLSDTSNLLSLTQQTDTLTANGQTETSVYDASTRTFTVTDPDGHTRTVTVTAEGLIASVTPVDGADPISYSYDAQGRLTNVTQGTLSVTYGYDAANNLVTRTDADGHVTRYDHDADGRTVTMTLPSGEIYHYGYDANGNLTSITMPSGAVQTLDETSMNQLASYLPPNNGAAYTWAYNQDRQLAQFTLPDGSAISSSYDAGGRPSGDSYPQAAVTYGYSGPTDRVGTVTLTPASGTAESVGFGYDGPFVTSESQSGTAAGSYSYVYDNNGYLTDVTLTSGSDTVDTPLVRDNVGLLTAESGFTLTRGGPGGLVSQISDGTLTQSLTYTGEGYLASRDQTIGSSGVYSVHLTYNNEGLVSQKVETINGVSHTFVYSYDADGQLTQVTEDATIVESYVYDANGNRTSATVDGTSHTATYDTQDRQTASDGTTISFDVNGMLNKRGSDTFSYDARGELLAANVGGTDVSFSYDGIGRRVSRTIGSDTVEYLYGDPSNPFLLTAERDDASGVLTTFYYDDNGYLFAFERGGATYYVATDQLGSPRVVTDSAGTIVKQIDYDSYGVVLNDSDPSFDLPIGFAGGLTDPTTGFVRFGYRDYDPESGRWTTRDPAFFTGGQANLYAYVGNNPVTLRDPLGLWCIGGSLYDGVGGGVQICHNDKGTEVCAEVGFGAGGSLSASSKGGPTGTAADNSEKVFAEVSASAGPLSVSTGVTLDDSGCAQLEKPTFGVGIGPVGYDTGSGFTASGAGQNPLLNVVANGAKAVSVQAKVGARVCRRIGGN